MQVTKRCANNHHTLIFNINETATDVATNKSTISWSIQLNTDSGWAYSLVGSTVVAHINGTEVYNKYEQRTMKNGLNTIASGTLQVEHNSDGSKTVAFDCSFTQTATQSWTPGNASLNGNLTLSTIPRATACPSLTGDIESSYTLNISPASSGFTHALKVVFGSTTNYLNASGNLQSTEVKLSGSSLKFTIPASFYQQFTGKSGTGTLTLITYSGSTKIGEKTGTITANCLESRCRPSISGTVIDSNATTKALTNNQNKLVKYFSNASISLTLKAATSSGDTKSTITARTCDDVSFSGTSITKNAVTKDSFTIKVTNSRGFSTSATIKASGGLVNYFTPSMNVNFYRPEQTGSNVKCTYSGTFFNASFGSVSNTIAIKWYWKTEGASSWTLGGTVSPTISGNNISEKTFDCGSSYNYQTNYRFKLEVIDKLGSGGTREVAVTSGQPIYSHGKNFFQHHTPVYLSSGNEILDYDVVSTW